MTTEIKYFECQGDHDEGVEATFVVTKEFLTQAWKINPEGSFGERIYQHSSAEHAADHDFYCQQCYDNL